MSELEIDCSKIDQSKPKQRVTLAEQKNAKAGLEALRKYQAEVRHEESRENKQHGAV
jgi:hypothetical protein